MISQRQVLKYNLLVYKTIINLFHFPNLYFIYNHLQYYYLRNYIHDKTDFQKLYADCAKILFVEVSNYF